MLICVLHLLPNINSHDEYPDEFGTLDIAKKVDQCTCVTVLAAQQLTSSVLPSSLNDSFLSRCSPVGGISVLHLAPIQML